MNKPATGEVITCEQLRGELGCLYQKLSQVYLQHLPQYIEHGSFSTNSFEIFPAGSGVGCIVFKKDSSRSTWVDLYADTIGFVAKEFSVKNKLPYVVREVELRMRYDNTNSFLEFVSASSEGEMYEVVYDSLVDISVQDTSFISENIQSLMYELEDVSKTDLQQP